MTRLALALAALVALTGCRAKVELAVAVEEDGSGSVSLLVDLDDEAVEAVDARAFRKVRVADLRRAGWEVGVGAHTVTATKQFGSLPELGAVVEEVSGPTGPFQDFVVSHDAEALRTEWDFAGVVDLSEGAAGALDPEDPVVQREFAAEGLKVEELRRELRRLLDDVLDVEVAVSLPGGGERFEAPVGERTGLATGTSSLEGGRIALLAGAALLSLVALLFLRGVGRARSVDG